MLTQPHAGTVLTETQMEVTCHVGSIDPCLSAGDASHVINVRPMAADETTGREVSGRSPPAAWLLMQNVGTTFGRNDDRQRRLTLYRV